MCRTGGSRSSAEDRNSRDLQETELHKLENSVGTIEGSWTSFIKQNKA